MHDSDEREHLDFLTHLIHEHHHEETRQHIDELFRRPNLNRLSGQTRISLSGRDKQASAPRPKYPTGGPSR